MSWFPFAKKNKSETPPEQSGFDAQLEELPVKTRGRTRKKDDQPDPALPEKKRARRRLIGAVAMTLALVIVLPMVLDADPKPVSEDVVIHIPSKHKPSRLTVEMPNDAANIAPNTAPSLAGVAPGKVEQAPSINEKAADKTTEKPAEKATDKAAVQKAVPDAAKTEVPKEKSGDKPAAEAKTKVMIQVAALASAGKVKELRARLKKAGFTSMTQKVETSDGERIRVRVGPYASKKEAEKVCPKLNKMKLKCTLVSN